jgi:hypothetical protein
MLTSAILVAAGLVNQAKLEPAHAENAAFKQVLEQGFQTGGQTIRLPEPTLRDGQDAEAQRAALRQVAGSLRALEEMLRNSVTAPYILKLRDLKTADATLRSADIWFVVYGDLKQVEAAKEAARSDGKEVEAANMWFQTRLLKNEELKAAGIEPPASHAGQSSWYAHVHAKLLDRIDFELTNHAVASQSDESVVIASRTDPAFDRAGPAPNGWKPMSAAGGSKADGSAKPYAGGMSYAKISRLALKPGALLVELHTAFVEPEEWFHGAPILRSKFGIVAQDQIRALRRELASKRGK